jgi:hypothetical protein
MISSTSITSIYGTTLMSETGLRRLRRIGQRPEKGKRETGDGRSRFASWLVTRSTITTLETLLMVNNGRAGPMG